MPTCHDCGNERYFTVLIEGEEEHVFDPETEALEDTELLHSEAVSGYTCSECESTNVEVDA